MEDVGAQVAAPIFIHQTLSPVARKRDLYYQTSNLHTPSPRRDDWNPKLWDWDSVRFVAKPLDQENLRIANDSANRQSETSGKITTSASRHKAVDVDCDDRLELNLGGGLNSLEESPVSRPSKRVRSGSPGGGNYPMCQVDNCKEDLSTAKDYHRRHKVCEIHSKATKALVGKQMQRFCQQCSRFHPLSEFDEGKRSCRRRLAGHNRRRRKTQPEDVTSRLDVPGSQENVSNGNLNLVALLTALACAQGNNDDKRIVSPTAPDRDQLIQILSKINSLPLPSMDLATKLQNIGGLTGKNLEHPLSNHKNEMNGTSPSTMNLLAALSTTLASSSHDALAFLSQRNNHNIDSEKTKLASSDLATTPDFQRPTLEFPSVGGEGSSSSQQSPSDDSDYLVQDTRSNLSLQLFTSSPEEESRPKLAPSRKYFSSDSSNPIEDRSASSSPVVHKLFPLQSNNDTTRSWNVSAKSEVNKVESTRAVLPLGLFSGSNRVGGSGVALQSFPHHSGYTSSGSDHSPASLNSDAQDRTGRIIFKLFDKDPSQFPGTLRTQIYNWLSNSPSEMESYIRPGCVFLSVYVSMSSAAWEQLEGNLLQRINCLVQDSDSDFWRNAQFLVNTGKQLASHRNGKIRLCKSWRSWNSPELISVLPLAVVAGRETTLVVQGRNLTNDGTKIHCTYMGSYSSIDTGGSVSQATTHDEINFRSFLVQGTSAGSMGRCFIEVENGFQGNGFPVIIADANICSELKRLEHEFRTQSRLCDVITEDQTHDLERPSSREEVLHFLNELGWLFQRKKASCLSEGSDYSLSRFKFLLIFSVERDCSILVKTLLDMLVERNSNMDVLSGESLETLAEIQLLNRAVKRRCTKMVEMLVHYSISDSKKYIFPPNMAGPGGMTPLHLAACASGADSMIDVLTNDPQEIALSCWDTLLDAGGQSPHSYAAMRNNHSYNDLVARKLADTKNNQISLMIENESEQTGLRRLGSHIKKSCATCASMALKYNKRIPRSQGLFPGPFIHSMVAVATVCVCVCLFMRAFPDVGKVAPFKWERLDYGTI